MSVIQLFITTPEVLPVEFSYNQMPLREGEVFSAMLCIDDAGRRKVVIELQHDSTTGRS